jgi:hypothetical protein
MSDKVSKTDETSVDLDGFCRKSPTGQHVWETYNEGSKCKYCGLVSRRIRLMD